MSNRALRLLADALRARRRELRTRWRRLTAGRQALLVVAYLRKGETFADLAEGFTVGGATAHRYATEGLTLLAGMAPTLEQAIAVAKGKAYVILDGSLLRIDRVAMASGNDRPYYSGKHKCHGLNVQVISDPSGRLIWISPPLPGARHDIAAAREHRILTAFEDAGIHALAGTGYQGAGPSVTVPQRRRRKDPDTGKFRPLSAAQKEVNTARVGAADAAQRQRHPKPPTVGQLGGPGGRDVGSLDLSGFCLQAYPRWRNANARHPTSSRPKAENAPASAANANDAGITPAEPPNQPDQRKWPEH